MEIGNLKQSPSWYKKEIPINFGNLGPTKQYILMLIESWISILRSQLQGGFEFRGTYVGRLHYSQIR